MVNNIFVKVLFRTIANMHVPIKIYREFYHDIIQLMTFNEVDTRIY